MKKILLKIILIVMFLFFDNSKLYNQVIIFDYESLKNQFTNYELGIRNQILKIYLTLPGKNSIKNMDIDTVNLTFKYFPYTSVKVNNKINDTLYCSLILDSNIVGNYIYIFNYKDLIAILKKTNYGFKLIIPNEKSYCPSEYDKMKQNSDEQLYVYLCNFQTYLIIKSKSFDFYFTSSDSENQRVLEEYKYLKLELTSYLNGLNQVNKCNLDKESLSIPGFFSSEGNYIK